MLMEAHCIAIQVFRAILFGDSPCCGGPHRHKGRLVLKAVGFGPYERVWRAVHDHAQGHVVLAC